MNYWQHHDKKMIELKKVYDRTSRQTQNRLQELLNTFNFNSDNIYNIANSKTKKRINTYIEQWKEQGLLTGYFGMLAKNIYNRTRVKNSEILELLIYGAYIEEQANLEGQEQQIMYEDANYYYEQGIKEIKHDKREDMPILEWAVFLAMLEQPLYNGYTFEQNINATIMYNYQQLYKQCLINICQEKENAIEDTTFQNIIKKQQNTKLSINGDKISGSMDMTLIGMNNCAKIEGIKSLDKRAKVKFISVNDDKRTHMCESLDGQIFSINDWNEFERYDGDSKTFRKYKIFGLVQGINMPPITSSFHWCRSTLTYQIDFLSQDLYVGRHLSDEEYRSIDEYLKSTSYKINSLLYNNNELNHEQKEYIDDLDLALSKMPKYSGKLFRSVYVRDMEDVNNILKIFDNDLKIGHWNSYISSSKGIYDPTFNLQFKIKSKTGRDLSSLNDEGKGEIVFLRNTDFKLKNIYIKNGKIIVSIEEV